MKAEMTSFNNTQFLIYMALVDIVMPRMGESIHEATILEWSKQIGDQVEEDETICLTQTDKVDSEIPSHVEGILKEILFPEGEVVAVGTVIAKIEVPGEEGSTASESSTDSTVATPIEKDATPQPATNTNGSATIAQPATASVTPALDTASATRFYSPLVKSIAKKESISMTELEAVAGSGANGRVTKKDIIAHLETRGAGGIVTAPIAKTTVNTAISETPVPLNVGNSAKTEIIEMDRMRKLIANHMVNSKKVSPHVTSFVEADVTNMVDWRNGVKAEYASRYGERITLHLCL